ncbi:MAG: hypothetical protein ABSH11_01395 [Verrucomicrobiota bacterium]|jgi:hypothetical protein
MNSFWNNLYDNFKDRRYGALFLSTILAFFGLLISGVIISAILREFGMQEYFLEALPGIGILGLAWAFLKFRRAQAERKKRLSHSPLSRDELRAARSKLRNGMKPINRPAPRAPDTNLKY